RRCRPPFDLRRVGVVAARGRDVCEFHAWIVDAGGSSLLGELSYLVESHVARDARDAGNVIERMRLGESLVAETIDNLASGLAAGRVASAANVRRAIARLDAELATPIVEAAMA